MNDAFRKLRSVAITAFSKIQLRAKDARPGKWEEKAYSEDGTRNWNLLSWSFLESKLIEEVNELIGAIRDRETHQDVLKEAGDVSNLAMFIADKYECFKWNMPAQPKVVCLCGSTKFKDAFLQRQFELTMKGIIVLSVGSFMHADKRVHSPEAKVMLDELHKRKIDLADEIEVINVGDYIGESTQSEILYARRTGKAVTFLEPSKFSEQEATDA